MKARFAWAAWLVDGTLVTAVWAGLLVAENVALGFLCRDQFSGIWEIALARRALVPLAATALAPGALAVAGAWRFARDAGPDRGERWLKARRILAFAGAACAAAVGIGVTGGRHFANLFLRAAFVVALAAAGAALAAVVVPFVAHLRRRPIVLASLGVGVTAGAWLGDAYVLPRLYPAFHAALFGLTLLGASALALALRDDRHPPGRTALAAAALAPILLAAGAASAARSLTAFDRDANLRRVLVEHAPLLGRAAAVEVRWRHPDDGDAAAASAGGAAPPAGEVARALDWTGHDILLLTVDALRADHVSSYGYARPTTPSLDALAAEGTLFSSAYCPTPHTSYSVTSTMTGKYLRPLLSLGLGEDSETWASDLRRYGWRTAAFYPPAVFFIDQVRFGAFESDHLGFEYAKVEFADPVLREAQVAAYLDGAPQGRPLFLWVHFFEPHEPYVAHAEHPFSGGGSADVDAYDSEVATADDGIGRVVRLVRSRRPAPVVIVTADHGEEFGDHGGRYHGTTVYEEQVRVPLVVVGPGVRAGVRERSVVQTIDLLPTALSALGIPRPARVRGRDLGALLAGRASPDDPGFAFAETDDYALVASGDDRLVCARRAAACELFRPADDPGERRDFAELHPDRFTALRAALHATERDHGRYETAGDSFPEALRRGMQGEAEAAEDVAALLDDADVRVRRKAAEVCFALHAPATVPQVRRALSRDEDAQVRNWAALALARIGEAVPPLVEALLRDPDRALRRAAALALGSRSDGRACEPLSAEWAQAFSAGPAVSAQPDAGDGEPPQLSLDLESARDLLAATAAARCRAAVPALLHALSDVRARPYVADALGQIGDDRARPALLALLADEPYVTTRPHEAAALLALGARDWPRDSSDPADGGPVGAVEVALKAVSAPSRLVVWLSDGSADVVATADGAPAEPRATEGEVRTFDLSPRA
ncbi:MAG: sulfatase-like hydrolase/transferase, partial [Polyangiaceae bacterium]|nr:sulfatase-like hydrolase/transferase [Polyangiaceae bacterium]